MIMSFATRLSGPTKPLLRRRAPKPSLPAPQPCSTQVCEVMCLIHSTPWPQRASKVTSLLVVHTAASALGASRLPTL